MHSGKVAPSNDWGTSRGGAVVMATMDLGVTCVAYAYCLMTDETNKIVLNDNWGASQGYSSCKTPSSLAMDSQGKLLYFGYEAEEKYVEQLQDSKNAMGKTIHFFRNFTHKLYTMKKLRPDQNVTSEGSHKTTTLRRLMHLTARYFDDHLVASLEKSLGRNALENLHIKWTVVTAAGCNPTALEIIREAFCQAELIDHVSSDDLVLTSDIDCALAYTTNWLKESDNTQKTQFIQRGTSVMFIDCGGFCTKIGAYEFDAHGDFIELMIPEVHQRGSNNVDREFFKLLEDIFTTEIMQDCEHLHKYPWMKLKTDFQNKKAVVTLGTESLKIDIPANELMDLCVGRLQKDIGEVIEDSRKNGVRFTRGALTLKEAMLEELFSEAGLSIMPCIRNAITLRATKRIDVIVLSGGFAKNGYFQQEVANAAKDCRLTDCKVIVLPEPELVPLRGGFNLFDILHRVDRKVPSLSTVSQLTQCWKRNNDT